jgi:hypothetical protein
VLLRVGKLLPGVTILPSRRASITAILVRWPVAPGGDRFLNQCAAGKEVSL